MDAWTAAVQELNGESSLVVLTLFRVLSPSLTTAAASHRDNCCIEVDSRFARLLINTLEPVFIYCRVNTGNTERSSFSCCSP